MNPTGRAIMCCRSVPSSCDAVLLDHLDVLAGREEGLWGEEWGGGEDGQGAGLVRELRSLVRQCDKLPGVTLVSSLPWLCPQRLRMGLKFVPVPWCCCAFLVGDVVSFCWMWFLEEELRAKN